LRRYDAVIARNGVDLAPPGTSVRPRLDLLTFAPRVATIRPRGRDQKVV